MPAKRKLKSTKKVDQAEEDEEQKKENDEEKIKKVKTADCKEVDKGEEENEEEEDSMSEEDDDDSEDESEDDEDEDGSGSEEESEMDPNEEMMVDFEAREMHENDLMSVNMLISQKLPAIPKVSSVDLAQLLIAQKGIGSVIYQALSDEKEQQEKEDKEDGEKEKETNEEDDQNLFGLLSVLDLNEKENPKYQKVATNLKAFFEKKGNNAFSAKLRTAKCAYIVNERFVNIPPAISVPMFESLLDELETQTKKKKS